MIKGCYWFEYWASLVYDPLSTICLIINVLFKVSFILLTFNWRQIVIKISIFFYKTQTPRDRLFLLYLTFAYSMDTRKFVSHSHTHYLHSLFTRTNKHKPTCIFFIARPKPPSSASLSKSKMIDWPSLFSHWINALLCQSGKFSA